MTPAEQLKGVRLANGWTVLQPATRKATATGGHFSKGYIVVNDDGRRGFLKAMDYTKAFLSPRTAEVLLGMTQAFVFEKTLCDKCAHLSRVARALDSGSVSGADPTKKVEYLIFELAERDIRAHLDLSAALDVVFVLKTLHHVATGLSQLHRAEIAHQDLKPSNVLVYGTAAGSKICDLGRAWDRNSPSPFDGLEVAGDTGNAPIDLAYGHVSTDHRERRYGCDLYHLGSLLAFLFSRSHMSALVVDNLAPAHRPSNWVGTYPEVLPHVQAAFAVAVQIVGGSFPDYLRPELTGILIELCNPDMSRRGNPSSRGLQPFNLQRYISVFNRLVHKAVIAVS